MKEKNPVRKERYENLKNASSLPFGKRMRYYFDFFKFHLLALFIVGVIVFFVLKEIVFAPDVIFYGVVVNKTAAPVISDEEFISSFPEYSLFLNDSDIESTAKLVANASSGDINVIICNEETFNRLCLLGLVEDLDWNADLSKKYKDSFVYYDHTKNDTLEDDPLGVKAYGIDISDSAVLKSYNAFKEDDKVILCVGLNSDLSEFVFAFIDWVAK